MHSSRSPGGLRRYGDESSVPTEFPVERYYRDAKSYQIVEGSSNIQKMIIAQDALGYRKANRGV